MSLSPTTSNTVDEPTGFDLLSELKFGNSNTAPGSFETALGNASGVVVQGRRDWRRPEDNSIDSGNREFRFDLKRLSDGSALASWYVEGAPWDTLTYNAGAFATIDHLVLQVGVRQPQSQVVWSGVAINFISDGSVTEADNVDTLTADTMTTAGWNAQSICTTSPSTSNYDEILITGVSNLISAPANQPPQPDDLFGRILIYNQPKAAHAFSTSVNSPDGQTATLALTEDGGNIDSTVAGSTLALSTNQGMSCDVAIASDGTLLNNDGTAFHLANFDPASDGVTFNLTGQTPDGPVCVSQEVTLSYSPATPRIQIDGSSDPFAPVFTIATPGPAQPIYHIQRLTVADPSNWVDVADIQASNGTASFLDDFNNQALLWGSSVTYSVYAETNGQYSNTATFSYSVPPPDVTALFTETGTNQIVLSGSGDHTAHIVLSVNGSSSLMGEVDIVPSDPDANQITLIANGLSNGVYMARNPMDVTLRVNTADPAATTLDAIVYYGAYSSNWTQQSICSPLYVLTAAP